jgi:hypothetical protein
VRWSCARTAALGALLLAVGVAVGGGCSSSGNKPKSDGGNGDGSSDTRCSGGPSPLHIATGQACACPADCQSGFCVDGVCCSTACTGTCKACNVAGSMGTCTNAPSGDLARTPDMCPKGDVSTCGQDGTCDGHGACRKYPSGTVCRPGTCDGAAVVGVQVCDGQGLCKAGFSTVCAPYNCDPSSNKCVQNCSTNTDCVSGVNCVNGSCGPKPDGAACSQDGDCASNHCADGVCCYSACKGPCVSCDLVGKEGICASIQEGLKDPHGICHDQGGSSCGQTGACDGFGGCALYPRDTTVCGAPSCSGDVVNTARTCDGLGTCRAPGLLSCSPALCRDGACISVCTSDSDCDPGHACVNGSCGPKQTGQPCAAGTECATGFCADGVCCNSACNAGCKSCALPQTLGKCTAVAAGASDPHNTCATQDVSTCGTNGRCDGSGGCQKYPANTTVCAPESCANNIYTPPSTCNAVGRCVPQDNPSACYPYICNGSKCFGSCSSDANCASPNVCTNNSCGKKMIGAFCSAGSECVSNNCAQGVCCNSGCASACKACNLPGSMGNCTNVAPNATDPQGTCAMQLPMTCGTNGKCDGAGNCQKYPFGTPCKDASCVTPTFTPASSCDGAGTCVTPGQSSCSPYKCGTNNACKGSCTADADCISPFVCTNGSCGKKPDGASCTTGSECMDSVCAQGVCCRTACSGSCVSCALTNSLGSCKPVAPGAMDPAGLCTDQKAPSCGTTGFCDGNGACALYTIGTQCTDPSCKDAITANLPGSCDGNGTCRSGGTQKCMPFACAGTGCNSTCKMDGDCASGNFCINNSCGKKRLGQLCGGGTECDSGNCIDGVCCFSMSCGLCMACNVMGSAGQCTNVLPNAGEPHGGCTPNPPCGFIGTCDGNGACQFAPSSTACGSQSCSGITFTPVGNCSGSGSCNQTPMTPGCGQYACGGNNACLTTCSDASTDCVPNDFCVGGSCTNLKPNGVSCVLGTECITGNCVENFCCGSPSCTTCNSCAVPNMEGSCQPTPGVVCAPAACDATSIVILHPQSTCDATGTCVAPDPVDCTPLMCDPTSAMCL